ncbi:pfs domain-containing protein [Daldinia decipiens]|uniref:pfs domain-containing protein n=1 Tax=Daldinia decipiens TaxID=326647 RepID=UPI0020C4B842|nr:pfs domain-containing protein [Daldinia decipiens]KAI1658708.1 pfs domain-containing protein [Daldinia decipiens]
MMSTISITTRDINTINLLVTTSKTIQEIAKILRLRENDGDLKVFYADLTAYCAMIRDHANRIHRAGIRIADKYLDRILAHLGSTLSSHKLLRQSACGTSSYTRLLIFNQSWEQIRKADDGTKLQFIKNSLSFGTSTIERNEFIEALALWEEDFRRQYPDDPSQWTAEDFAPQRNISEPSYAVWSAAKSIFSALMACKNCSCPSTHDFGARLSLGTYRKPASDDDTEEDVDFDMFLSMKQDWQEARVHTMKETVVQWAIDDEAHNTQTKRKKSQTPAMRVKRLCEPIVKIKKMTAHRLEFKVTRGRLYKLQSERSQFLADKTKDAVTLEQFLRGGSRSFTERTRRILAILLSYAVLHLHDTPWLKPTWNSSDIIFFRTATTAIPLRPFIQTRLSDLETNSSLLDHCVKSNGGCEQENYECSDIDPDDIDPDDLVRHQCPSLVTLAAMLMEVYFVTPFEILAKKYGVELEEESSSRTTYLDVDMVFRACRDEIPENFQFHSAVERCLDPTTWEDEDGNKLDDKILRTRIYQEVVRPLENELIQTYSSISIDDLDRFAQTIDFGSWDQTISDLCEQTQSTRVLSPSETVDSLYSCSPSPEPSLQHYPRHINPLTNFQHQNALLWAHKLGPYSHPTHNLSLPSLTDQDVYYKESRFFDDETISEAHSPEACSNYLSWKFRYQAVYDKFITPFASSLAFPPVKIAILDTGIDLTHPDVEARSDSIKGKYNLLNEKFKNRVHDRNGHGTFGFGLLLDYAPDAQLYVAKIAEDKPSNPRVIAEAITLAVDTWKVDVISMSFGFPTCDIEGYDELELAIMNAYSKHVLLFAAASNSGGQRGRAYPAREQNVICINSTDANGNRSGFSPTAVPDDINLATVGEAVESAWPVHLCDDVSNPSCIKYKSGTSYSTPIAAGIAAFLLQYARLHLPEKADALKRQKRMEAVLRRVAEKGPSHKTRDEYHFIDLSLYADSLFGKDKRFIDLTIGDLLVS